MSYEDKYYAMCDHDSEQQGEGYSEAVADVCRYFEKSDKKTYTRNEVIKIIEDFQ